MELQVRGPERPIKEVGEWQRYEAFFRRDSRCLIVEQLSQLFRAGYSSATHPEQLGELFYKNCFAALRDWVARMVADSQLGATTERLLEHGLFAVLVFAASPFLGTAIFSRRAPTRSDRRDRILCRQR